MNKNTIGQFISALRRASGMTQQDLADRLNVSNKAVSRWERDECAHDLSLIPAIAEIFDVTCDELLKGERIQKNESSPEKKEPKVEKQIKAILNGQRIRFKTNLVSTILLSIMVWATTVFIAMYSKDSGAAIGFDLGFTCISLALAIFTLIQIRGAVYDNELFESASSEQMTKFNKSVFNFSYVAFSSIFAAVILSLPLLIPNTFGERILNLRQYFGNWFWGLLICLGLVLFASYKSLRLYILGERTEILKKQTKLNIVQCVLLAAASLIIVYAPKLKDSPRKSLGGSMGDTAYWVAIGIAVSLLVCGAICLAVFLSKAADGKKELKFSGIRNICLYPAAAIISQLYKAWFETLPTPYPPETYNLCTEFSIEYLWLAAAYCLAVVLIFELFENKKKIK